jgi:hypothetical protein
VVRPKHQLTRRDCAYGAFVVANVFSVSAAMCRRRALASIGELHDRSLDLVADWDLWARVAAQCTFEYLPGVVTRYRQHQNMSLLTTPRQRSLRQTFDTLDRITNARSFALLPTALQQRALLRHALIGFRLRRWPDVRGIVQRGLSLRPVCPSLLMAALVAASPTLRSIGNAVLERRWQQQR